MKKQSICITNYQCTCKRLPEAFDGTRWVVLADLHERQYGTSNLDLKQKIKACRPDYICIAGDMVIGKPNDCHSETITMICDLAEQYPVYYADGNHERKLLQAKQGQQTYWEIKERLLQSGVFYLTNETISIERNGAQVQVSGLTYPPVFFRKIKKPHPSLQAVEQYIGLANSNQFQILLAHHPMYFEQYVRWGADIVFSGHLHGGMIRIPKLGGLISPQYEWFPKYDAGMFQKQRTTMIVSRGLGWHTLPVRIGNPPELVCVQLNRSKERNEKR